MKNQHRKELGSKAGFLPGYDCTGLRNVVQNLSFCAAAELTSCRPWGHPNTTIFLPTTREDVSPGHARLETTRAAAGWLPASGDALPMSEQPHVRQLFLVSDLHLPYHGFTSLSCR